MILRTLTKFRKNSEKFTYKLVECKCERCDKVFTIPHPQYIFAKKNNRNLGKYCSRDCVKLNNKSFDLELKNTDLKRIGNYSKAHNKIKIKCKKCGYKWRPEAYSVLKRKRCPVCTEKQRIKNLSKTHAHLRLTREEVDERLAEKNLKKITNYKNKRKTFKVECLKCNYRFTEKLPNIVRANNPCFKCRPANEHFRLTEEEIKKRLKPLRVKLVDKYKSSDNLNKLQCIDCKFPWEDYLRNVFRGATCDRCNHKKTGRHGRGKYFKNIIIPKLLNDKKIVLKSKLTDVQKNHDFECETCFHQWSVRLSAVLYQPNSCPDCSLQQLGRYHEKYFKERPHMKNEKGCLYFYKFIDGKEKFIKIGITRVSSKKRLERIRVYRNKDQIFEIKSKLYKCYKAESDFKRLLKKFRYIPKKEFAGDNECYLPQDNFAEILNKNMQKHFRKKLSSKGLSIIAKKFN